MPLMLAFGVISLLAIGWAAGSLTTLLLGGRLISDHAEGRFAKRERPEPEREPPVAAVFVADPGAPGWQHIGHAVGELSIHTSKTGSTSAAGGATAGGSAAADGRGETVAPLPASCLEETGGPAADGPLGVAAADRPAGAGQRGEERRGLHRRFRELGRILRHAR